MGKFRDTINKFQTKKEKVISEIKENLFKDDNLKNQSISSIVGSKLNSVANSVKNGVDKNATKATAGLMAMLLFAGMTAKATTNIDTQDASNLPCTVPSMSDTTKGVTTTTELATTTTTTTTTPTTTQPTTYQSTGKLTDFNGKTKFDLFDQSSFLGSAKVMTFNVRLSREESNPTNNWDNRKEVLVDQIERNNPDIIGFQEIEVKHINYFIENLEGYDFYYFTIKDNPNQHSQAIFYKSNKFDCVNSGKFYLSETPDQYSKGWDANAYRIAAFCTLKEKISGNTFNVYNVHLDHIGQEARVNGAQMVVDHINESGLPTILLGDFNAYETNPMYDVVTEDGGLEDVKYSAETVVNDTNTYNAWNQSARSKNPPIDFIFYTPGDFEVESYQVLDEDLGRDQGIYASDHFAVVADIEF